MHTIKVRADQKATKDFLLRVESCKRLGPTRVKGFVEGGRLGQGRGSLYLSEHQNCTITGQ